MKKFFTILLFLIIVFSNINKVYAIEPDIFVQSTVNRAAKTLGDSLTKEERIEKLKDIARETVDIKGIGFYSLGSHRKSLNKEQLENYKNVFAAYFLKSFASRLATIVSSTLVATDTRPEVKIEWRIYTKDPENFLIRDLIIEGLSLARTQKEEFSSIINSNDGNIDALLKNLSDFSAK